MLISLHVPSHFLPIFHKLSPNLGDMSVFVVLITNCHQRLLGCVCRFVAVSLNIPSKVTKSINTHSRAKKEAKKEIKLNEQKNRARERLSKGWFFIDKLKIEKKRQSTYIPESGGISNVVGRCCRRFSCLCWR